MNLCERLPLSYPRSHSVSCVSFVAIVFSFFSEHNYVYNSAAYPWAVLSQQTICINRYFCRNDWNIFEKKSLTVALDVKCTNHRKICVYKFWLVIWVQFTVLLFSLVFLRKCRNIQSTFIGFARQFLCIFQITFQQLQTKWKVCGIVMFKTGSICVVFR